MAAAAAICSSGLIPRAVPQKPARVDRSWTNAPHAELPRQSPDGFYERNPFIWQRLRGVFQGRAGKLPDFVNSARERAAISRRQLIQSEWYVELHTWTQFTVLL